jgi:hypothetical protein
MRHVYAKSTALGTDFLNFQKFTREVGIDATPHPFFKATHVMNVYFALYN